MGVLLVVGFNQSRLLSVEISSAPCHGLKSDYANLRYLRSLICVCNLLLRFSGFF